MVVLADGRRLASYDSETDRFRAGLQAPPIVCASTASFVNGKIVGRLLFPEEEALDELERLLLDEGVVICFANASYDLAVAAEARPRLLPLIFRALQQGRIHDTLISQALDQIYYGLLGVDPVTRGDLRSPSTGKTTKRYSHEIVHFQLTGKVDAKVNDAWRKSYALLRNFPPASWPEEARVYPVDDAVTTLEDAVIQRTGKRGPHAWIVQPAIPGIVAEKTICKHCGGELTFSWPVGDEPCLKAPCREHQNQDNLPQQVEAGFAAWLGACHSFRTDPEKVAICEEYNEAKAKVYVERFRARGWIRDDGSEDVAAVKKVVATAYGASGTCKRCGGSGEFQNYKTVECRGEKVRGRYQGCRGRDCLVCHGEGSISKPGSIVICKNVFDGEALAAGKSRMEALVDAGCDGTGFDIDPRETKALLLPRSDALGVKTNRDTLMESGDEDLYDYGFDEFRKSLTTYVPYLKTGIAGPLKYSPNVIVATGRYSYEESPLHQMPRKGKERECIRARGAWCGYPVDMVLGSTDYEAGELCLTGDTRILTEHGYRPIAELVGKTAKVASRFVDDKSFIEERGFYAANVFATGVKDVLKIATVDGRVLKCTGNHPVLTQRIYGKRQNHNKNCPPWRKVDYAWKEAKDIVPGDTLVLGDVSIGDDDVPKVDSKFYTLGHFLGDGWLCENKTSDGKKRIAVGVCASGNEIFLLESVLPVWESLVKEADSYIRNNYERKHDKGTALRIARTVSHFSDSVDEKAKQHSPGVAHITVSRQQVARLLIAKYGFSLGRATEKRLPPSYWTATVDQKRSFLRGLYDADGSVVLSPRKSVSFTAANSELARDVQLALSEFGIESRATTHSPKGRGTSQTILQVRGFENVEAFRRHVLFLDDKHRSVKAEKLSSLAFTQKQKHRHGLVVKTVESVGKQPVYNLEVSETRNYVAEGIVVHNCTLSAYCYWVVGQSKMMEAINASGKPGILHSDLAAQVLGLSLEDFLVRLKAKDKQAVDFRQAAKPYMFGRPGLMGPPKIVFTSRGKNSGFTPVEGGPSQIENDDGTVTQGYYGIRFCILIDGQTKCGVEKITQWKKRPCIPVCRRCVEVVDAVLGAAYIKRYPEMPQYFDWVARCLEKYDNRVPNLVWDHDADKPRIVRWRGGDDDNFRSAACNSGFQGMLGDVIKDAYVTMTRECYLGVTADGQPSPLAGCRIPLVIHDEPLSELILETAHLSGPRIAEIMIASGKKIAPHVVWKAETALSFWWSKSMEPNYHPLTKQLIPWEPPIKKVA